MQTAKLFINGKSQAVRLPKEFRFAGKEVFIKRFGDAVLILPERHSSKDLHAILDGLDPDFQIERNQPKAPQKRRHLKGR